MDAVSQRSYLVNSIRGPRAFHPISVILGPVFAVVSAG